MWQEPHRSKDIVFSSFVLIFLHTILLFSFVFYFNRMPNEIIFFQCWQIIGRFSLMHWMFRIQTIKTEKKINCICAYRVQALQRMMFQWACKLQHLPNINVHLVFFNVFLFVSFDSFFLQTEPYFSYCVQCSYIRNLKSNKNWRHKKCVCMFGFFCVFIFIRFSFTPLFFVDDCFFRIFVMYCCCCRCCYCWFLSSSFFSTSFCLTFILILLVASKVNRHNEWCFCIRHSATVLLASQLISKNEHTSIHTRNHGQCEETRKKKT